MTVSFLRKAHAGRDGRDGVLYRHGFGTGYQDLVFANHGEALKFANSVGAKCQQDCKLAFFVSEI